MKAFKLSDATLHPRMSCFMPLIRKQNMYKTDCFATYKSQWSALAAVVPSVPSVASTLLHNGMMVSRNDLSLWCFREIFLRRNVG